MKFTLIPLLAALLLAACAEREALTPQTPPPEAPPAIDAPVDAPPVDPLPADPDEVASDCNSDAVQWAVGQLGDEDLLARARDEAGAQTARFLRPGEAITMEYLSNRLNLELDESDTVVSVRCG